MSRYSDKGDPTGLVPVGRNERDGRYRYLSLSTFGHRNEVAITHVERVGLAVVFNLLSGVYGRYRVYPQTRSKHARGYGAVGERRMWLARHVLASIGAAFVQGVEPLDAWRARRFDTVAHEVGHNRQPHGTKPHGPEFRRAELEARIKLQDALRKGWPKIDMRKLRESRTETEKKRARKAAARAAAPATNSEKWRRELTKATGNVRKYEAERVRAERLLARWENRKRHAETWLRKAEEREG